MRPSNECALAFGIIIHACLSAFYTGRRRKKVDATSIFFTILNIEVTVLGQKNSVVVVGLFDHIYGVKMA